MTRSKVRYSRAAEKTLDEVVEAYRRKVRHKSEVLAGARPVESRDVVEAAQALGGQAGASTAGVALSVAGALVSAAISCLITLTFVGTSPTSLTLVLVGSAAFVGAAMTAYWAGRRV
jgi:hypothetical protein